MNDAFERREFVSDCLHEATYIVIETDVRRFDTDGSAVNLGRAEESFCCFGAGCAAREHDVLRTLTDEPVRDAAPQHPQPAGHQIAGIRPYHRRLRR